MAAPAKNPPKKSFKKALASGAITGGIEICITYPTEYLKTYMQLYPEQRAKGFAHCVKNTYRNFGPLGFYRGLSCLLTFSVPKTGIRFGLNETLKTNVFTKQTSAHKFLAGLFAGVGEAICVVTVMETIKVKIIHDRLGPDPKYKGFLDGVAQISRKEGLAGLYKGLLPTMIKQGTNQGIRFLSYAHAMDFLEKHFPNSNRIAMTMIAGGFAGAASVFGNNPIDVVKTNMQSLHASKYKGSLDCFTTILKEEGIGGLYKGTIPRLSRVVLDVAITFTLFEQISKFLSKHMD